jgi:hypothetical protein
MAAAPQLDCQAKRSDDKILVRYTLDNRSDEAILAFAALYTVGPNGPTVEPNRVYTLVEGDQLTLAKAVIRIKPGIQLEIAEVPYGIKLASGARLSEEIRVSVPVEYDNPHDLVFNEATISCRQCRFAIGYARWSDVADKAEVVRLGEKDYFRLNYRSALKQQHVMTSEDLALGEIQIHQTP